MNQPQMYESASVFSNMAALYFVPSRAYYIHVCMNHRLNHRCKRICISHQLFTISALVTVTVN